ncbi:MAG: hypothetical protein K1X89_20785 [Myxococcaceae bacterium]|nr:hypothetical protein [Myxococcaceae bacterium]
MPLALLLTLLAGSPDPGLVGEWSLEDGGAVVLRLGRDGAFVYFDPESLRDGTTKPDAQGTWKSELRGRKALVTVSPKQGAAWSFEHRGPFLRAVVEGREVQLVKRTWGRDPRLVGTWGDREGNRLLLEPSGAASIPVGGPSRAETGRWASVDGFLRWSPTHAAPAYWSVVLAADGRTLTLTPADEDGSTWVLAKVVERP